MKKLFLTIFSFLFFVSLYAQTGTDLQFSQTITKCSTSPNSTLVGTVPTGKIWKVVGVSVPSSTQAVGVVGLSCTSYNFNIFRLDTNNNPVYAQLPMFINENQTVNLYYNGNGTTNTSVCVSIIEYTVTQ